MGSERWVLVVEDGEDEQDLVRRAFKLAKRSERLVFATEARQAMGLLDEGLAPSLLLIDNRLPGSSGMELARMLRDDRRLNCVPFVLMSGAIAAEDREDCFLLGVNSFVRKPVEFDAYMETFRKVFDYWLDVNHDLAEGI